MSCRWTEEKRLLDSMLEAAQAVGTRLTLRLEEVEKYRSKIRGSRRNALIFRLTAEETRQMLTGERSSPRLSKGFAFDLVEIELDPDLLERSGELRGLFPEPAVLSAVIRVEKEDIDPELRPTPALQEKLESLFRVSF